MKLHPIWSWSLNPRLGKIAASLMASVFVALVACQDSSNYSDMTPVPVCQGGVLYDTGGTNGFGRVAVTDSDFANFAPIDIAFVPGSMSAFVVVSQNGYLHYFNGACAPRNAVDLNSLLSIGSTSGEQGLLNIEFHPNYANNRFAFVYYTSVANTVNSVARVTVSFDSNGNIELSDVVGIIHFRKATVAAAANHNGGGLAFAPDGSLLASVGDGGANSASAQDNRRLLGKVIRILPSLTAGAGGYAIPSGNMFAATNTPCSDIEVGATDCPEILAKGLRNPFRLSIDGNIVYLGEVGTNYEEINSFNYTSNTLNFGWPTHDGPVTGSTLPGYRNPIVAYRRGVEAAAFRNEDPMATSSGLASVMIGSIYRGSNYSGLLDGALLFGDFYDGYIRYVGVAPGTDGNGAITDTDGVPGAHLVHENAVSSMVQGPDGYVYMTTLFGSAAVYQLVRP